MAEFCKQCAAEMSPDWETDFKGMFSDRTIEPNGHIGFNVICEGCGPAFIVDDDGTCNSEYCDMHHGIDTSDIPEADEEWFKKAELRKPKEEKDGNEK